MAADLISLWLRVHTMASANLTLHSAINRTIQVGSMRLQYHLNEFELDTLGY